MKKIVLTVYIIIILMIFFLFKVGMIGILASMVDLKQWRREIGLIIPRIAMAKILNALLKSL